MHTLAYEIVNLKLHNDMLHCIANLCFNDMTCMKQGLSRALNPRANGAWLSNEVFIHLTKFLLLGLKLSISRQVLNNSSTLRLRDLSYASNGPVW